MLSLPPKDAPSPSQDLSQYTVYQKLSGRGLLEVADLSATTGQFDNASVFFSPGHHNTPPSVVQTTCMMHIYSYIYIGVCATFFAVALPPESKDADLHFATIVTIIILSVPQHGFANTIMMTMLLLLQTSRTMSTNTVKNVTINLYNWGVLLQQHQKH
jgi:hypothetical protein